MKKYWSVPLLFFAFVRLLSAQDIRPGPLVWLIPDDTPDELPVARGLPDLDVSADLRAVREPAYAEYRLLVSADGNAGVWDIATTSPWLPTEFRIPDRKFIPAKRAGKPVASEVALYFIYNPAAADPKTADAIPRLLSVQPPIYPVVERGRPTPECTIRVLATIDAKGEVTAAMAVPGMERSFGEAAAGAVRSWTFAPARRGGQAVAAELELGVVFQRPVAHLLADTIKPPKPIKQGQPVYPYGLFRAGFSGQVELEFTVTVEGRVTEAIALRSTFPAFEDAALNAIKQWRFTPALKEGRPVSCKVGQRIVFTLDDSELHDFKITRPKSFPPNLPEQMRFEVPPHLEYLELPVYPLEDLRAQRGGKVTLVYLVGPDGKVHEVSAMPGAPSPSLAAAAVAALEQFRFKPPGRQGKPCSALLRIDLEFSPDGRSGHAPVTEATQRIKYLLEKSPEKLAKARNLDRIPERRHGDFPKPGPSSPRLGEVLVEFVLDRDGIPQLPRIVSASDPALGYTVIQAFANWRFSRPQSAGKYVDVLMRMPFVFKK